MIEKDTVLPEGRVPVGRAVRDVEIFLVNEQGQVVENSCDGRIAVRSAYLRQGYWRRPDETREKFQMDPCAPGARIFITNDMGHFLPDGNLEHLGRADRVVKTRGLRVDLAEVEAALHATDLFQEAVATTFKDISGGCQLVICVVPRSGNNCSSHACRQAAQQVLPLPSRLVMLEELPRLVSGKIDRVYLSRKASETFANKPRTCNESIDAIEFQLVRIWENILAVEAVGTTDDFFALGGDSLSAATMSAAVEKFLGINLPTSTLLEAPTIKELAEIIRCGGLSESDLRLVTLRLGGTRPPLHYVTYPVGNALEFRFVARHFSNDQPVFAFRPPSFDVRSSHPRSVEEMAKSYIETMRVNQPRGPYYLCGSSFGGVVAFEMARQLEAGGEEVAFLGLLDSHGGEYPKRRKWLTPRKRLKQALLRVMPHACYTFNLGSFKSGVKEQVKRWLARGMIILDSWLRFCVLRCPLRLRNLYIQEICHAARRRYKLLPFTGKIDLFRAEIQPPNDLFEEDPLLGWSGMATGGIDIHQMPGHHYQYLVEPGTAAVVAAQIEACLAKRGRK